MCGKEIAGFAAAEASLYRDRPFVLCPLERTTPEALAAARSLALAVGGRPIVVDPGVHDCAVAAISHLPYAVAATLVRTVDTSGDELAWALAASGFRDTTAFAASDVDMMLDTLLTNRDTCSTGWTPSPISSPSCAPRWPTAMKLVCAGSWPPRRPGGQECGFDDRRRRRTKDERSMIFS